jgi:hypothetical protein
MEQQDTHIPEDEQRLTEALRAPRYRLLPLHLLRGVTLAACALTMGLVLVSDPKISGRSSSLTQQESTAQSSPTETAHALAQQGKQPVTEIREPERLLPLRAISALGALTGTARTRLRGENHDYLPRPIPPSEPGEQSARQLAAVYPTSASNSGARPTVSVMPRNRIPVRRSGIIAAQN